MGDSDSDDTQSDVAMAIVLPPEVHNASLAQALQKRSSLKPSFYPTMDPQMRLTLRRQSLNVQAQVLRSGLEPDKHEEIKNTVAGEERKAQVYSRCFGLRCYALHIAP